MRRNLLEEMKLRDYFAGQSLIGINTSSNRLDLNKGGVVPLEINNMIAQGAYNMADAMLKERKK